MAFGRRNRHKKKRSSEGLELNMTAMCDVVFQLLIYLILTAKPPIVYAHLDVTRPRADETTEHPTKIPNLVEIIVASDACTVLGTRVTSEGLKKAIKRLADLDKTQTIMIKCSWDSPHERLIEVLDACSSNKLANISVMSM